MGSISVLSLFKPVEINNTRVAIDDYNGASVPWKKNLCYRESLSRTNRGLQTASATTPTQPTGRFPQNK